MNVSIKADFQFSGGCSQGHESIPGMQAFLGARAKTDISFANPLADSQFGGVVMQGQFRILQNQQQRSFLFPGFSDALIQVVITGMRSSAALLCRGSSGYCRTSSKEVFFSRVLAMR